MILRRLHISGFGKLGGEVVLDTGRINIVVGTNESGKSTLAAAIAAALYGLEEDRRGYRGRLTPRDQYEPWSGKPYAVELVLEAATKQYTINRHFGRNTVSLFVEGEGDVSEEFRTGPGEYAIGEMLLGVNLDQFARSAFWLQPGPGRLAGSSLRPDESLSSMLERQASSVAGDASAQIAQKILDQALRQYEAGNSKIHVVTRIRRLQSQIAECNRELKLEEARMDRAGLALRELQEARKIEAACEGKRRKALFQVHVLTLAERESSLRRDDEARAALQKLYAERDELSKIPALEGDTADRLRVAQVELEAASRSLEEIGRRRELEVDKPMAELEVGLEEQRRFAWARPIHLEELDELERESSRLLEAQSQAEAKQALVTKELERAGISVRKLEEQRRKFADLTGADTKLLTHYPASAQAAATARQEADEAVEKSLAEMKIIGRERLGRRLGGGGLLVIGLVAAVLAVWFALRGQVTPSFVGLAATLVSLAVGALFLIRGATHRADERNQALRSLTEARRHQQEIKEQVAQRELALSELSQRLNISSNADLLREHAEYQRAVREGDRLLWVRQDVEKLSEEEAQVRQRCWQWATRVGAVPAGSVIDEQWNHREVLKSLRSGIVAMIALRSQQDRLSEQERRIKALEQEARDRKSGADSIAKAVVESLGTPAGDWEKAFDELDTRRRAQERYQQVEKTIPEFEKQVLSDADRKTGEREISRIRDELEQMKKEHPKWLHEQEPGIDRGAAEQRRRQTELALEEAREKHLHLVKEIGRLEEETQNGGRASQLRLELAELEHEKARAERFEAAVRLAMERLQSVARQTHALWSEYLSRRVNELLPALGPQYRGFAVTDTLEYSLEVEGQRLDREKLDQVLSTGTRDQLSLALRLAVCEFLSREGEPLPLILDDPFSRADDERADAGLRFLAEAVAPTHQLLLLTCHRQRLDRMREDHPGWFADHVNLLQAPIQDVDTKATPDPGAAHTIDVEEEENV